MRIRFHGRTDPGRRRATNEDAFAFSDAGSFCVLCDGMGGHSSGEVASRMAVELLGERLRRLFAGVEDRPRTPDEVARTKAALPTLLQEWLRLTNDAIYERGASEPGVQAGRNMGTTLALLCIVGDLAVVAHIGDSRIYRIRGERIQALTRDHSVTAAELGGNARSGRKRKYVTRALGTKPEVIPDLVAVDVRPGDFFVVCSDGLTDVVRDEEIAEVVRDRAGELQHAPPALVNLANERGGRDNVTVVVASVEPEPDRFGADPDAADAFLAPPPLDPPPPWESSDLEEPV